MGAHFDVLGMFAYPGVDLEPDVSQHGYKLLQLCFLFHAALFLLSCKRLDGVVVFRQRGPEKIGVSCA
jgi:hypothetical protein